MYVYLKTEPQLWTVGHYAPDGEWIPESDHSTKEQAANKVILLNGGSVQQPYKCPKCESKNTKVLGLGQDGRHINANCNCLECSFSWEQR